ncbi:MAG: hypothetical protein ACTTJ2_04885 [Anaerovoracaceae bacterium]
MTNDDIILKYSDMEMEILPLSDSNPTEYLEKANNIYAEFCKEVNPKDRDMLWEEINRHVSMEMALKKGVFGNPLGGI